MKYGTFQPLFIICKCGAWIWIWVFFSFHKCFCSFHKFEFLFIQLSSQNCPNKLVCSGNSEIFNAIQWNMGLSSRFLLSVNVVHGSGFWVLKVSNPVQIEPNSVQIDPNRAKSGPNRPKSGPNRPKSVIIRVRTRSGPPKSGPNPVQIVSGPPKSSPDRSQSSPDQVRPTHFCRFLSVSGRRSPILYYILVCHHLWWRSVYSLSNQRTLIHKNQRSL